ncbi:unnamed protein product [Lasius platythorax]|uniref:Uncharacterized protein n=1 Tax=Lasius platythorax TaxID=488582 RepID=A0AAV2MZN3_9HYME
MLSGALCRIRVQATWRKVRLCYDSGFQARRVLRNDSSAVTVPGTTSVSAPIVCCYASSFSLSTISSTFSSTISSSSYSSVSLFLGGYDNDGGGGGEDDEDEDDDDDDDDDDDEDDDNDDDDDDDGSSGDGDNDDDKSTRRSLSCLCLNRQFHHRETYR